MGKSLGTIEVVGLSSAIVVADAMAKTANIEINDLEITKGFGFVTVKIFGDVGAVKAAISAGSAIVVADAMAKTANIEINDLEITKGFGFVTVKIFGDVGAVKAAISAGKSLALQSGAYVASNVIARPNMDLEKRILSFKEEKKEEPKKEEVKEEPKVEEKVRRA